jgi:uncharacterized phosphosugar-binding protein
MDFHYFDEVEKLLKEIREKEKAAMEKAVHMLTDAILNDKTIWVFGASHAGILSQELFYRAGGLMLINPIFAEEVCLNIKPILHTSAMERLLGYGTLTAKRYPIKQDDILIVHSVSGRNPVTIEVALWAKSKGAKIICLTNLKYSKSASSRHPSGLNLYETADLVIDNHGEIGDACVSVDEMEQKTAPTSTIAASYIFNAVIAQTVEELVKKGLNPPPVFYSANVDGGDEKNAALIERYKKNIHYL